MQEVSLYELLKFYFKNWLVILSLTAVGLLIGYVYNTYIQKPMYKSSATLLLINSADKPIVQDTTLINNYIELFKSRRVLEPLIEKQHLNVSYANLLGSVDATNDKDTQVIKVGIATDDPHNSKALVDGAVVSFKEQVKELYGDDNVTIVDDANSALPPYNIHKELQLALATVAGFILSIIVLFFVFDIRGDKRATKRIVKNQTIKKQKAVARLAAKKPTTKPTLAKKAKNMLIGDAERARPIAKKVPIKKAPTKSKPVAAKKSKKSN